MRTNIKFLSVLAGSVILAACASTTPSLDDSLHGLIGHKKHEAFAILGHARSIHPIRGGAVYTWIFHQKMKRGGRTLSKMQNDTGAEIAAALQQNPNAVQRPTTCNLIMTASHSGIIINFRLQGDPAQCGPLKQRFAGQE